VRTTRFIAVVEAAGKPDMHVLLAPPEKDNVLQTAIRLNRVMTIYRERPGKKADHGTVGFDPGRARQILIFPRSLSQFAGTSVIGIKYELLEESHSKEGRKSSGA
jgi:hypothetical protein